MGNTKMKYEMLRQNGLFQKPVSHEFNQQSDGLMQAWKFFCAQPIEHKKIYVKDRLDDCGYVLKETEESFTISLGQKIFDESVMSIVDAVMLDRIKSTLHELHQSVIEIADVFDVSSWFNLPQNLSDTKNYWKLKFTKYFPAPYQTVISSAHVDNGITVLIAEDQPGLEVLWEDCWQSVSPDPEHILIYPGLNSQFYSECKIPALCHRVVSKSNNPDICRNSINLFLDFSDIDYGRIKLGSNKEIFPDGKNYKMPFNQFKEYFYGVLGLIKK